MHRLTARSPVERQLSWVGTVVRQVAHGFAYRIQTTVLKDLRSRSSSHAPGERRHLCRIASPFGSGEPRKMKKKPLPLLLWCMGCQDLNCLPTKGSSVLNYYKCLVILFSRGAESNRDMFSVIFVGVKGNEWEPILGGGSHTHMTCDIPLVAMNVDLAG